MKSTGNNSLSLKIALHLMVLFALALPVHAAKPKRPPVKKGAEVHRLVHWDVSPALRDIPPAPGKAGVKRVVPNRPLPKDPIAPGKPASTTSVPGPTLDIMAPSVNSSLMGVGNGFTGPQGTWTVNVAPPDTVGDVGPAYIVQSVNSGLAVLNKSGTVIYGPVGNNTLWSGFGGGCQSNNDGDPTVNYDQLSGRWVIAQFSVSTTPYLECVAVSATDDPTGSWYRYSFQFTDFNDYPKVGTWPDGYYITYNMFTATSGYGRVCVVDRENMIQGKAARSSQCFNTGTNVMGLLPSDLDGTNLPPAGSPNYVMRFNDGSDRLEMWKFHVDWSNPANSTFSGATNVPVSAFTSSCVSATRGTCIPQQIPATCGTFNPCPANKLESLADRLMNRLAYRNLGTHESLVVSHTVGGDTAAKIRWYELRNPNGTPQVFQQSDFGPDTNWRWMPGIAMDQSGNIGLGYSISSSSMKPDIYYTGRLSTDPINSMQTETTTILSGITRGSQVGKYGTPQKTLDRWGDYSAMVVDPTDDCTFWYTTEYIPSDGIFNWSTRIASFKFGGCAVDSSSPIVSVTAPANGATVSGNTVITGSASDNKGVTRVEVYLDSALAGILNYSPYNYTWDTTAVANGNHTIGLKSFDLANNSATSTTITVNVNNAALPPALTAAYNATLKAPVCGSGGRSCDSGATLLNGRDTMSGGNEPNQPNTINSSCADGTSGSYHSDESIDRLSITTNDSSAFAGGKAVTVSVTTWCWGTADSVDIYYTSNASSPSWTLIGTQTCTASGARTFTAGYTLPSTGSQHAVRGNFRYQGSQSSCSTGAYDDHDDLVFGVNQAGDTTAPTTSISSPTSGLTVAGTITISATASDNVGVTKVEFYVDSTLIATDTTSPYSTSWNTTTVAAGSHSLTSKAYDAANNTGTSTPVAVTVDNAAPTTSITAPTAGSTVSGSVTVSATASDNIAVSRVEFYVDSTTLIGTDTTSPFSISWSSTGVSNGAHNLTSKAFDAANNSGTSTAVNVTVNNAATCGSASQLFSNAGFESGASTGWTLASSTGSTTGMITNSTSRPARTGTWYAWLNGFGRTTTQSMYQQITIPSAACTAQLSFWVRIDTAETTTTTAYDKLQIQILNTSGAVLSTLATYSNLNKNTSYTQKTFDLSAYKGQTIRVRFNGTEDGSLQTSFVIDDTAINITQ